MSISVDSRFCLCPRLQFSTLFSPVIQEAWRRINETPWSHTQLQTFKSEAKTHNQPARKTTKNDMVPWALWRHGIAWDSIRFNGIPWIQLDEINGFQLPTGSFVPQWLRGIAPFASFGLSLFRSASKAAVPSWPRTLVQPCQRCPWILHWDVWEPPFCGHLHPLVRETGTEKHTFFHAISKWTDSAPKTRVPFCLLAFTTWTNTRGCRMRKGSTKYLHKDPGLTRKMAVRKTSLLGIGYQ